MKLYLIQHARAKSKDEDPERPITAVGREETEKVAEYAAQNNIVNAQRIFHSGKKRAEETAGIFARAFKLEKQVAASSGLGPTDDVREWVDRLANMDENVILVGHLPHLNRLASFLLSGSQSKVRVDFKNSGIVSLSRDKDMGWSLNWMFPPETILGRD